MAAMAGVVLASLIATSAFGQGRVIVGALEYDCTDPLNTLTVFHPTPPDDPRLIFVAQVTVLRTIAPSERQFVAKGQRPISGGRRSLLVRVDQIIRGDLPTKELEVVLDGTCIQAEDYAPGTTGIVAGDRIIDTQVFGGPANEFLSLYAKLRFIHPKTQKTRWQQLLSFLHLL